jgi:hypothetical protein
MKSIFKFVLAPAVLAAAAFTASSATAETTVNVPFNFTADGHVCPAGLYTVKHDSDSSFVTLSRKGTGNTFTWIVGPADTTPSERKIALNFDAVGNQHVLQSVQYGTKITSRLDKKTLRDAERDSNQLTGGR